MIVKKKIENIIIANIINTIRNHRTSKLMTSVLDLGIIDPMDKYNLTHSVHTVSTKISIETARNVFKYFMEHHSWSSDGFLYYSINTSTGNYDLAISKDRLNGLVDRTGRGVMLILY